MSLVPQFGVALTAAFALYQEQYLSHHLHDIFHGKCPTIWCRCCCALLLVVMLRGSPYSVGVPKSDIVASSLSCWSRRVLFVLAVLLKAGLR